MRMPNKYLIVVAALLVSNSSCSLSRSLRGKTSGDAANQASLTPPAVSEFKKPTRMRRSKLADAGKADPVKTPPSPVAAEDQKKKVASEKLSPRSLRVLNKDGQVDNDGVFVLNRKLKESVSIKEK